MFRTSLLAATALVAGITIGGVAFHASGVRAQAASSTSTYEQLNLFGEVFERIRDNYVEPADDEKLIEAAVNGMLTSLDPHSSYLNQKDFGDMQVQTKGEFGGLGIEVTMEEGLIKVVSPMDGTPAAEAGLQPGDYHLRARRPADHGPDPERGGREDARRDRLLDHASPSSAATRIRST